jgi:hypothetical protein
VTGGGTGGNGAVGDTGTPGPINGGNPPAGGSGGSAPGNGSAGGNAGGGTTGGGTTGGGATGGGATGGGNTGGGTTGGGNTGGGNTGGGDNGGNGAGDNSGGNASAEQPHKPGRGGRTRQTQSLNGSYTIIVAGAYNGKGTAKVNENSMVIEANITGPDGTAGTLTSGKLLVDGPYFVGTATVVGKTVQISGRLDALNASRVIADFKDASGKTGRIVGTLDDAVPDNAGAANGASPSGRPR